MLNPEGHLENIINAIGDNIFVKDRNHKWVLMNDANVKCIGYPREELINKSDYDFFPKKQADVFWEMDELVFKTKKENLNEEAFTDGNGEERIILTKKTLYKDNEGNEFIVGVSRDITERKKMENQIKKTLEKVKSLSLTDELTKLYNRRGFTTLAQQQLKLANRRKAFLVLLYVDMDDMKMINDKFGHKEGDRALQDVSRILKSSFRESDIVGRIGGDEFVVLAIDSNESSISILTSHLNKTLAHHNQNNNRKYQISLSVGVASYAHIAPCSVNELMDHADKKMYKVKQDKKRNGES